MGVIAMGETTASLTGDIISGKIARSIPRTSSVVSPAVKILIVTNKGGGRTIGFIQELTPIEGRHVHKIHEHGNEEIVELVPGGNSENTIRVKRIMLYYSRLIEVFDKYDGRHHNYNPPDVDRYPSSLLDFNLPFDIQIMLRNRDTISTQSQAEQASDVGQDIIVESYIGCWFTKLSYTIKTESDFLIYEEGDIQYTYKRTLPLYSQSKGRK